MKSKQESKKEKNVTGIMLALLYCVVTYFILMETPNGEPPNHPIWLYSIIPIGATLIRFLFDYVIKFDFFRE